MRCWFIGVDPASVSLTVPKKLEEWQRVMTEVFRELGRILQPGGHVAFEVGEVRGDKVKLEEAVVPCGMATGLKRLLILINDQKFTKTANCWGVDNNAKGTNTNRIVVFEKACAVSARLLALSVPLSRGDCAPDSSEDVTSRQQSDVRKGVS